MQEYEQESAGKEPVASPATRDEPLPSRPQKRVADGSGPYLVDAGAKRGEA